MSKDVVGREGNIWRKGTNGIIYIWFDGRDVVVDGRDYVEDGRVLRHRY